jgi:DNA-binding Lrp family transcriptional regulator
MLAFIQIAIDRSNEQEITEKLRQMKNVKECHILFGEWDVIAKLEMPTPEVLGTFIMSHIRTIPGVRLTSTMIVAK